MRYSEEYIIKSVSELDDCYDIRADKGNCFIIKKKYNVIPKIGDNVVLHTKNFSLIRGIELNGVSLFYKTDQDLEEDHKKFVKKLNDEKIEKFKKNRSILNEKYNNLPSIFKTRINKFRKNNPYFRVEFEQAEMFVIEQAIEVLKVIKDVDKLQEFADLDFKKQKKLVPNIDSGHSGNTFGITMKLAYWYLKDINSVPKVPGAMEYLVGSKDYGGIYNEEAWKKYKKENIEVRTKKIKNLLC
jgi:predicted secreted acid phosphatase